MLLHGKQQYIMKKDACHELKKEIRMKIGGLDNEIVA
jgi:hypothetical protein